MDLDKYQELTGITVPTSKQASVTATIRRTRSMLETMLGFTLDPKKTNTNLYNELGKSPTECSCLDVDTETLEDPDEVINAYRLYPYNKLDTFFSVDPFEELYSVKLVFVRKGESPNGVTIKTFDTDSIRAQIGRAGWSKYIQHCVDCLCVCNDCSDCVQLAVDALWFDQSCLPEDLLYVWADMITFYSDQKRNIKSESIDTHSYTRFDKTAPETDPTNIAVIKRYAGPFGSVVVMPV